MTKTILAVQDLEKTYHTKTEAYTVLKKVNLNIQEGEFVTVMGPSGSGKTTLLNIVSGFLSADSGHVYLSETDLLCVDEDEMADIRQSRLGFIFQDFMLLDGLTAKENILLPQTIAEKKQMDMMDVTDKLMRQFGIEHIAEKYPNEISGGQKQRVAIARALSNHPLIILADEPTGNLDSKSSAAVMEAFLAAQKTMNATILMVTHDAIAASQCDRVVALSDGQVVRELVRHGEPRAFLDKILEFMGEVNGNVPS